MSKKIARSLCPFFITLKEVQYCVSEELKMVQGAFGC